MCFILSFVRDDGNKVVKLLLICFSLKHHGLWLKPLFLSFTFDLFHRTRIKVFARLWVSFGFPQRGQSILTHSSKATSVQLLLFIYLFSVMDNRSPDWAVKSRNLQMWFQHLSPKARLVSLSLIPTLISLQGSPFVIKYRKDFNKSEWGPSEDILRCGQRTTDGAGGHDKKKKEREKERPLGYILN